VAGRHGFAAHGRRPLLPDCQHVVEAAHRRLGAPQREQRAGDLLLQVGGVVLQIDRGAGPVVLAHAVDVGRVGVGAHVGALHVGGRLRRLRVELRLELLLGSGRGAHVVEPVKVRLDELERDVRVEVVGRHDIEHGQLRDRIGMIERQPMPHASAAVVADHGKARVAEVLHHLDLVEGHCPLRVVGMALAVGRLAAGAVAAQVGHVDGVGLRQVGRHQPPRDVRLRCAVQQQHRRSRAAAHDVDLGTRRLHPRGGEAGKELRGDAGRGGLAGRDHRTRRQGRQPGQGHRVLQQFAAGIRDWHGREC